MTQIYVYVNFAGNCREAMNFYKECLGGELFFMTVGESPMASQMPEEARSSILHSSLTNGSLALLASDMMQSEPVEGNTMHLSLNCSSEEEITTFFTNLSSGGQVTHPLTEEFWGATFGMLTDKYGKSWLLNYDKPKV